MPPSTAPLSSIINGGFEVNGYMDSNYEYYKYQYGPVPCCTTVPWWNATGTVVVINYQSGAWGGPGNQLSDTGNFYIGVQLSGSTLSQTVALSGGTVYIHFIARSRPGFYYTVLTVTCNDVQIFYQVLASYSWTTYTTGPCTAPDSAVIMFTSQCEFSFDCTAHIDNVGFYYATASPSHSAIPSVSPSIMPSIAPSVVPTASPSIFPKFEYLLLAEFAMSGSSEAFNVVRGAQYLVVVCGASGGQSFNREMPAGRGGCVRASILVTMSATLQITVGGAGTSGTAVAMGEGGYNGGGNSVGDSSRSGGGGGGASSIQVINSALDGAAAEVIIVAGGGGGSGN